MSQQDLNAFADWLVANQSKKGTPEYETVANAFKELDAQLNPPDTSFSSAFAQGIDQPFENMATTARALGMEGTADALSGLTDAPVNYESASDRFINPQEGDTTVGGFGVGYLPRAAVEQAGQFIGSMASRAGGAGVGALGGFAVAGPPGAATGAVGGALAGPALFEFVQQLGPIALERARNNGRTEPEWDDWTGAAAAAGVSGALNSIGVGGGAGSKILNRVLREGATETAQSAVEQTGSTAATEAGLEVSPRQAIGEGIIGGTSAGGVTAATKAATAPIRIFTGGGNTASDPEAAADLANRLQSIADANDLNLSDIDKTSTKGAREAVDKAHVQLSEELKQISRDLRQRLQINDTDELSVVIDKVLAAAGQREARNKTKNTVGREEFDAIQRLAGDTAEGQRMLRLMRQMNELTELHNSGYQGGLSKYTDQLMPFGTNIGYDRGAIATERLLRPLVSGGAALQTGGASLVGQAAIAGVGRAVDAVTGRRSNVRQFVKNNAGNQGVEIDPTATSLRDERRAELAAAEQQAAQEEQRRLAARARAQAMHADVLNSNTEYPDGSPQQIMSNELGLSPQQLIRALKTLVNDPIYGPAARAAIRSLRRGGKIPNLGMVIKRLKRTMASKTPPATRDRPIISGQLQVYEAQEMQRSAAIQQGIRDNQALNDQLQAALRADNTVSEADRAVGLSALEKLRRDLSSSPVQTARAILDDAANRLSDPTVATKYILPYVDRVNMQQNARATSEAPTAIEGMSAEPEINQMAVPDFGQGQSIFPVPPKLTERVIGVTMDEGDYRAMPQNESVTGQTFDGARVYIDNDTGRGGMEVDADQQQDAEPSRQLGRRFRTNLVKKHVVNENGNIGLRIWNWVEQPDGNTRAKDDQESLVAFEQGKDHFYTLNLEMNVPTELAKDQGNINAGNQPYLRPRGFGQPTMGKKVGSIRTSQGKVHPVYDTIRVEPKDAPEINQMSTIDIFNAPPVLEGTGKKGVITVEDVGRYLEKQAVDAGSKAPRTVRGSKETNTIDYTPELEERLFQDILAEAREFYKNSPGSAYWYTFGSPKALDMMSEVIPELKEDGTNHPDKGLPLQMLFWTLISPLSGGQDPVANGKLAVDVLRYYIENGTIPLSKYRGGLFINDDAVAEREAKGETLAWTARGRTTSNALAAIQNGIDRFGSLEDFMIWMTSPHPHAEVQQMYVDLGFGSAETAKNSVSPEYADENGMTYGSQILGPKFGPFMLNNTGNESKVTKDEWFTRSWNRLVGRMFTANGKEMLSQPSSPTERMVQDRVITRVANEMGLQPAQLQALWWAYEQSLYTKLGVKSPTRDYVDAAKTVIEKIAGEAQAANAERQGRAELGELVTEATQSGQDGGILFQRSFDFDGTGDNGQLGRAPGLANSPVAGSREPTPTEVEQASRTVQAVFDIGKPGSQFENGVPDIDAAKKIAEAINVAVHIAGTPATTAKHLGKKLGTFISQSRVKRTAGYMVSTEPSPEPRGRGIGINTKELPGKNPNYALYVMLHELGHVFESSPADPNDPNVKWEVQTRTLSGFENVSGITGDDNIRRPLMFDTEAEAKAEMAEQLDDDPDLDLRVRKAYENVGTEVYSPTAKKVVPIEGFGDTFTGTFRDVLRQVLNVSGGKKADLKISKKDAEDIINEIISVQRSGVLQGDARRYLMAPPGQASIERAPNQFEADFTNVRTDYYLGNKLVRRGALTQSEVDSTLKRAERTYFHSPHELAADLLGLYMLDPAGARAMMPKATRLARLVFRDNPTIQFFSMPFASVVAIVLANMLVAEGEEQEEEQMDPGALSMQPGALTA